MLCPDPRHTRNQGSRPIGFAGGEHRRPDSMGTIRASVSFMLCWLMLAPGCGGLKPEPATLPDDAHSSKKNLNSAQVESPLEEPGVGSMPRSVPAANDWFEDVTAQSQVNFTYRNGREANRYYMIESFGGGVGAIDFDGDGDIDFLLTGGGTISTDQPVQIGGLPHALFRNQANFRLNDVTSASGLGLATDYSQGCAVTDYDVDGFPDLFVCCYGRNRLYHNLGDGTFSEVRDASQGNTWSTAASFADIDRDGFPDLFIARYTDWSPDRDVKCDAKGLRDLCGPSSYSGTSCLVFRNSGDGTFEDWSQRVGIKGDVHGLAVVAADLNLDGRVDFYIASDVTPNQLYWGSDTLPLQERAESVGVALNEWGQAEGSMGVDVADYDGDGRPDIWVTNFELEDNSLYHNEGDGVFMHASVAAGLSGVSRMRVGFGTSMSDFNGDGWPDLFVLNGNPIYAAAETPFRQHSQLFRNLRGHFEEISEQGGTFFRQAYSGRGNAAIDLNDDGLLDLVVVPMNEPVRILRNHNEARNFVRVRLRALQGEPEATGAQVRVMFSGRRVVQFAVRGTGFFSQADPRMILPVEPTQSVVDVIVRWPGRGEETFHALRTRESHLLIEGHGSLRHD